MYFLVRVCAVIGGVFAVSGMIDTLVFHFIGFLEEGGRKKSGEAVRIL